MALRLYRLTQDMDVHFMTVYLSLYLAETAAIVDFSVLPNVQKPTEEY